MIFPLFIFLIALLAAGSLWIGAKTVVTSGNHEDYFLAGRKLGIFSLAMTLLATQLGGGIIIGTADEAYRSGWIVIFYPLGMALGLFILGLGFGAKIRKLNVTTIAEIFQQLYQSIFLRKFASLLSIISLFLILVGQGIAARMFFYSVGLQNDLVFIFFWIVLIIYTVFGGLKAVVYTDILQACFIVLSFVVAFLSIPERVPHFLSEVSLFATDAPPWLTWLSMPLLYILIGQDMGQRCASALKPRTITLACFYATLITVIVGFVPVYIGVSAQQSGLEFSEGTSVLISYLTQRVNPVVSTFIIVAVFMAIISTADSLLCSISSNIAIDFDLLKNRSVNFSRFVTLFVGLTTLIVSLYMHDIVQILMFSYELAVSILFIPILMGVIQSKPSRLGAILAMTFSGIAFLWIESSPYKYISILGIGALAYGVGILYQTLQTSPQSEALPNQSEESI
ncbi:MAG: sodium:solute symporter family protein [Chlamydiales bacterium]